VRPSLSFAEWEAYLDEALPPEAMAELERRLVREPRLAQELATVIALRDAGIHSLGAFWRKHRLTCLSREQLGSYLLGTLPEEWMRYIRFHLEVLECPYCRANYADLRRAQGESPAVQQTRRKRYFESSAGILRRNRTR